MMIMQIDAEKLLEAGKPLPKYLQLRESLLRHFQDQHYQADQKISSENELIELFGVSRITVRQALAELVNEGVIYKKHGSGSFFSGKTADMPHLSHLIGVLTPRITYYIYPFIIQGIDDVARGKRYNIVLGNTSADPEKEVLCLRQLLEKPIDGLLFEPTGGYHDLREAEIFRMLQTLTIPVVLMDWAIDEFNFSYVSPDDFEGGLRATNYLIQAGHRRIAFIYPHDKIPGQQRYDGYRKALENNGIAYEKRFDKTIAGALWDEAGSIEKLVKELLDLGTERPTALFFFNDDAALRAYAVISAAGLKIPDDLSVVGYDDSAFAARAEAPLTSVAHPKYHIGKWAAEILFEQIEQQEQRSPSRMILKPTIAERKSVKSLISNELFTQTKLL